MSFLSKIRDWFTGKSSKSSSSSRSRASRVSNYGGGGSRSYRDYSGGRYRSDYEDRQETEKRRRQEQAQKRRATTDALASISKRTDALSSGRSSSVASSATSTGNGTARVLAKINEKSKATPPDPKVKAAKDSRERATKMLKSIEDNRKAYNKATGDKYNVKKNGLEARQAQKSQAYDVNVEKQAMKAHPIAMSAGRGALSGVTFGGSELAMQRSKNRQKSGAEQYYQKNKNRGAEIAGEVAGSLVGFGLTEKAATKVAGKVAPKALKSGGEKAVEYLAKNPAFRKAAQKEAERAGIKVTEEVLERFARQRAGRIVGAVGEDMAVNMTTGGLMDINQSIRDSYDENGNFDWNRFGKEMGTNALMNVGLGGAVTVAPAWRKTKGILNIRARDDAVDLGRRILAEGDLGRRTRGLKAGAPNPLSAPRIGESLDRTIARRSTQTAEQNALESQLPQMRQAMNGAFTANADEARRVDMNEILQANEATRQAEMEAEADRAFEEAIDSARTVEDFMNFFGLDRPTAEILARDRAKAEAEEIIPAVNETVRRGIPKGNIKPLAENLRTNEFMTRSGKPQYVTSPRSVSRVDTSIEGMTKQLDDLKGQTGKTDRERRAIETKIHDIEDRLNRAKWRREGGADMEAMRKAYRGEYEGFDMSKTTNGYQSDVLEGKYKGRTATIVEMSPDEYMERAYRQIFKKPSERGKTFADIPEHSEDISKYAEAMRNGEKFPLPYLDYAAGGQEGRHRALAAKEAGIDKIPVVIIDNESNPKAIIEEVSEATEKALGKNVDDAIQEEAARAVKEDFNNSRAEAPAPQTETSFPYEDTAEADEMMQRINEGKRRNAETYTNEQQALEGRVRELENEPPRMEGDEPLRVNNVAEDTPIGGTTMGERMARSAYERNTGETVDEGIKTSWHDAWEASREYHASHATGNDNRLSRTSVSQLNMMDSEAERELRDKLVDEGWLNYTVVRTDEMLDKVSKQFRDDPRRWVDDMIDINNGRKLDFRETPEWQAMTHYIMAVVDPSADPASEIAYTEAFKLATQMSSKAGQTNNLRRQFVHLTPAGRRDAIIDEMAQILYNSQGFHNQHRDIPSDKYDALAYVKEFLEGDEEIEKRVKKLVEVGGLRRDAEYGLDTVAENAAKDTPEGFASVADDLPTGEAPKTSKNKSESDEIMEAHADLIAALNEKNPKSKLDVVQEIRYLNMLGNPKTHIRNIFGSGFFSPIRQTSNMIRSLIERSSYVKNSGLDVTLHGGLSPKAMLEATIKNPTSESGKKALEAYERVKPELLGSMKLDNQLYSGRSKHLTGKILDAISDFNSTLLSKEDDYFKQRAFRENYIKSYEAYKRRGTPITKKIEKKIEAEAMQEAQIATFNEYNEFANFLARITKNATNPNASGLAKAGGIAVNAVMPFTKVPANIMKQSINYSPLGLAKGFSRMRDAVKRGDSDALNKAIDELSSGLTGTGIFGMGMLLGKTTDWFTTNAGKDDAAAKFKKQQGVQNYSATLTLGGKKYSVTLDWLVPNSATFFAGVEMANQLKSGDFNVFDFGGSWAQVTSRIIEPVMETSMLSGLYSMLESTRNGYGDDDKQSALSIMARETAQSYINSLAPTMLGQAARTMYKNDKQITGVTDNEYFRNQLKSKLGLAETNILGDELGADTTAYGDVKGQKETAGDYVKSGLKNFLSPANIQKVDLDEVDQAKIKQYEDAVKNGADPQEMAYLFPKKQYKKEFTTGDMQVKLSNKDLSAYNQAKTTGGAEGARYALESIMFNRYTLDANGKKQSTSDAYTPKEKAAIIKQFEGKSIREVEKWVREQPQFKNASEAEQKKVIDGLWSYSKQGKAQSAKRVGEQAVIEAQGGDVNEYNFNNEITEKKRAALQPFIDNGTITYEEAVDFARYAGKTYYYEDDEGGHSQTYYNKGVMMDYLKSKGYDDETAAALFNAFKASNAKEYGSSSRRRGYRRRGYRRWHRRGHGSSKKATVPTPKALKASDFKQGEALVSKKSGSSSAKVTPPALKRVKAKIDLPTVRKEY